MGTNGDTFDERLRSRNGHRIMDGIGPTIERGLWLEFGRELSTAMMSRTFSSSGRTSGLQSAVDPVSRSCRIQRVFVGVTDQHRLKFKARFLLRRNSPIHFLLTLQSRLPSDVLSSPDRLHRTRHIRSQNRGTNRNGLIEVETSDVSESSKSNRISTSHLFARRQAADKAFKLTSFNSSQRAV